MLDEINIKKDALLLIKNGCKTIKKDASQALLIKQGIAVLKEMSGSDLFSILICAIGYEKLSEYEEAIRNYGICINSLPTSPLKDGIKGMQYRALTKFAVKNKEIYKNKSIHYYENAFQAETDSWWKKCWYESRKEVELL